MHLTVFSTKPYDKTFLQQANQAHDHDITFLEASLNDRTAALADRSPAVCAFVNDQLGEPVLTTLAQGGTKLIALRCAGFNQVDLEAAHRLGITVARVPAYSPQAVAEHAVGLMLALNRKIYRAYHRVREGNFSLEGLMGFQMHGTPAGIYGTGKIGQAVASILAGFGCKLYATDPYPNDHCKALGVQYVPVDQLLEQSEIITLHCPLTPETHHLINAQTIKKMKPGAMLINTSRGAVVDTPALIRGLKSGRVGAVGLDVYEEEADLFFRDLSAEVIQDDVFARLLTFPNVVVTAHQSFFTKEALQTIAKTTIANVTNFEKGRLPKPNQVTTELIA